MVKIASKHEMGSIEMRAVYAETLIEIAKENPRIVDLEADLMGAGGMGAFKKAFPDRLINVGIAEQTMITMAAGLSVAGYIPFAHSFGPFVTRRPCDQVYISCAYSKTNVKIVGSDPGITGALNGGTHQAMEDIAILRPIPGITILEPSDPVQMKWAVKAAAETEGLFYIRFHRKFARTIYEEGCQFQIGKGVIVREGMDATILALGVVMLDEALLAAEKLKEQGISVRVVDLVSVKPIDRELIVRCARETGAIVVAENHFTIGGVSSAVSEVLTESGIGIPYANVGVRDSFGEVGQLDYLLERFEMTHGHIAEKVRKVVAAKP